MKRGQSALEYLVTYGWAILAIVIIAGVLWYLGIFNPTRFSGGKQCGGFTSFICQDFTVAAGTGDLTIVLSNSAGSTISNVNILTGTGGVCTPSTVSANGNTTCTATGAAPAGGAVGDQFNQITVSLNYTDSNSGLSHTDSGFVQGKYE